MNRFVRRTEPAPRSRALVVLALLALPVEIAACAPGAPPPGPMMAKSFDMAASPVPVQGGENSYRVQVSVTFEIGK